MKHAFLIALFLFTASNSLWAQGYKVNRTEENKKVKLGKSNLGKNIIAFAPVVLLANNIMDNAGGDVGIGFSYERIFNNEYISVKLPFIASLNKSMFYLTPTIKLYPKKQGVVKYSVGPQFLIGFGEEEYERYFTLPGGGGYTKWVTEDRKQFGFGLNNCINFTVARHFYLGMEATLGILYYDSFYSNNANNKNGMYNNGGINQTFQMGFSMGYRF